MEKTKAKRQRRLRRRGGIRKRIFGTAERPRLTVFRSQTHMYAQLIDDVAGRTLAASSTLQLGLKGADTEAATKVGVDLAEKAKQGGVAAVQFDRNGFKYQGRVKALADAAREGGLKF